MNKKLLYVSIITFLLIVPLSLYIYYFPVIINSFLTNVFIVILISVFILALIYGTTMIGKRDHDVYYILPPALIFIFICNALANIRLRIPMIHDPYYYFVATLNIIQYGTLQPILSFWYSNIDLQLHWPILELLTTNLTLLTNMDPLVFIQFLLPFLGVVSFLFIFIFVRAVSNDNRISLLAALISSVSGLLIFYSSEFHPQSFAPLFFVMFIYFYLVFKTSDIHQKIFGGLMLLTILIFAMSHHFSSLFIAVFALIYIFVIFIFSSMVYSDNRPKIIEYFVKEFRDILGLDDKHSISASVSRGDGGPNYPAGLNKNYKTVNSDKKNNLVFNEVKDYNLWILIAIAMISFHIFAYSNFIAGIIYAAISSNAQINMFTFGTGVPLYATILSASKWIVFIFALPGLYLAFKNRKRREFRLLILFVCFILAGVIGSTIVHYPLDRVMLFYYPFAAFFAALTFFMIFDNPSRYIHGLCSSRFVPGNRSKSFMESKNSKISLKILIVLIISVPLIMGFFSSQTPAYFFKDSGIDTYYWFSNDLSSADRFENVGTWIYSYTNNSRNFSTEFDTRSLTFYYGKRTFVNIYQYGINTEFSENNLTKFSGYAVFNPSIPYNYQSFSKNDFMNNINTYYSDGKMLVGGDINL